MGSFRLFKTAHRAATRVTNALKLRTCIVKPLSVRFTKFRRQRTRGGAVNETELTRRGGLKAIWVNSMITRLAPRLRSRAWW